MTMASGAFTLGYDPAMRLAQVSGLGQAVKFGYDGLDMVAETDSAGAIQRRYVNPWPDCSGRNREQPRR